jgi:SAM-dependent methyltransferase
MNYLRHNQIAWDKESTEGSAWSTPVDAATIARAKAGDWQIILTPKLPVPRTWFGEIKGKNVLCLASGGGQQAPILAAAGATVVSFDLSDEQLAKDQAVAAREGLALQCMQGDMADLSRFDDATFDLIFHPASNMFVPDVAVVWRECHRVLRAGGQLLAGFMNPALFMFDHEEAGQTGSLTIKRALPYSDLANLDPLELQQKMQRCEPLEFSHSLNAQIGGQIEAGFVITGFYEDHWLDDTWLFSKLCPVAMATRALKET